MKTEFTRIFCKFSTTGFRVYQSHSRAITFCTFPATRTQHLLRTEQKLRQISPLHLMVLRDPLKVT